MAVMMRTDERRKHPSGQKSPPSDASFALCTLLVTTGQSRLAVCVVAVRSLEKIGEAVELDAVVWAIVRGGGLAPRVREQGIG